MLATYTPGNHLSPLSFSTHLCLFPRRSLEEPEIRAAIPPQLFVRDIHVGLYYVARDILLAAMAWFLATKIDDFFQQSIMRETLTTVGAEEGW